MTEFDIVPFPGEREVVVDAGFLAAGRHLMVGLVEVDVTLARLLMKDIAAESGTKLSFTAFLVACLARAIQSYPMIQAYRDWRGRLILFRDVDVVTMIEPSPGAVAIPHIIRAAQLRSVQQITEEIRAIQANPGKSEQSGFLVRLAPRVPRFTRMLFFRIVKKNPHWFKRFEGTVVVTSVGMFGKRGGWGIGFLPVHTFGLTVGGMAHKAGVVDGSIEVREVINLTLSFDHDIVDGAPAARFTQLLIDEIETAAVLQE